jgi:glucosamine--fructose-6-phosphate aminotransferase (isomerizing)
MCGIFGAVGQENHIPKATKALSRLEYRGYDSAGIAYFSENKIERIRQIGGCHNLQPIIDIQNATSTCVIGHTRWATHGKVTENNTHPHYAYDHSLIGVHNGIIENSQTLKEKLLKHDIYPVSETDSEIAISYIALLMKKMPLTEALKTAQEDMNGSFAIALLSEETPQQIFILTKDRQIALGKSDQGVFFASDEYALLPFTEEIAYPDPSEILVLSEKSCTCSMGRMPEFSSLSEHSSDHEPEHDFMQQEIDQQPQIFAGQLNKTTELPDLSHTKHLHLVACGTSYHAAQVAKYWFLNHTPFSISVERASEYRYIKQHFHPNTTLIVLSQSGETADTLSALRHAKPHVEKTIALCNVPKSTIARECDHMISLDAGREFGVASTKAFTSSLVRLAQLIEKYIDATAYCNLNNLLASGRFALTQKDSVLAFSKKLSTYKSALFIGRLASYPLAMEGALKLKEITYIHAEAYPTGELKHGPIALIDENMPTIALVSQFHQPEKTLSNIEEIKSRNGQVFCISDIPLQAQEEGIYLQHCQSELDFAIASTIIMQLLALYTCQTLSLNPDKPRNLAKSVTVE